MKRRVLVGLSVAVLALTGLLGPPLRGATDDAVVQRLLEKADDMMRGESSEGKLTMHVKTARWDRTLSMNVWSQGTDKSLVQITDPAKERGMATLKVDKNIWNYLPKVDRTIKVPASMMSGSWMGSHFTNDDIVKDARYSRDFHNKLLEGPEENDKGLYVIESIPKPDTPVVWGKIIIKIARYKMTMNMWTSICVYFIIYFYSPGYFMKGFSNPLNITHKTNHSIFRHFFKIYYMLFCCNMTFTKQFSLSFSFIFFRLA